MSTAKGVSRVGGLAVAVGLGVAVAGTPGVAVAAPGDSGSPSDSSSSSPSSDSSSVSDPDSTATSSSTVGASSSESSESAVSADGSAPKVVVHSSGGAKASGSDDDPAFDEETAIPSDAGEEVVPPTETTTTGPVGDEVVLPDTVQQPLPASAAEVGETARSETTLQRSDSADTPARVVAIRRSDIEPRDRDGGVAVRAGRAAVQPRGGDADDAPVYRRALAHPVEQVVPAAFAAPPRNADEAVATTDVTRAAAATSQGFVSGVVAGLSAWVGLTPGAGNAPVAPVQSPAALAALALVRRETQDSFVDQSPTIGRNPAENSQSMHVVSGDLNVTDAGVDPLAASVTVAPLTHTAPTGAAAGPVASFLAFVQHTFFNQTPTIGYILAENIQAADGVITGDLNAMDADGDPLSLTVTENPENGSVVINPDGTFTYTPSPELAVAGGTDEFTVKASDAGWHLHGPFAFFLPDFGHSATATVAVTVTPVHNVVIATIDVGISPLAVAFRPDDPTAYVTNAEGTVSVIHTATRSVTATIGVDSTPVDVAVSPDGTTAYVTNLNSGTVSVIETATNTVTATITGVGSAGGVAVSPDGATAYVTNRFDDTVLVIDTATKSVTAAVTTGDPTDVAVTPDGNRLYVANSFDDTVSVIDTATKAVTDTIDVGDSPRRVAVSPDGAIAYVTNRFDDTVSVIETSTNTVTTTITVGNHPLGVVVSPDGAHVYVANEFGDTVSVIDTATRTVTATIDVGNAPVGVAVSPDGAHVYVTNRIDGTVSVIRL